MITINHDIIESSYYGRLYDPTGKEVGILENELQLYDVQIKIVNEKADGYYIIWNGQRMNIDSKGQIDKWPDGYMDRSSRAYIELMHARQKGTENEGKFPIPTKEWRKLYV